MRQHPVNPVEVLPYVFQEKDRSVEVGEVRCPDQALDEGEIPAQQEALGNAAPKGHDAVLLRQQHVGWRRQPPQASGGLGSSEHTLEVPA